MARAANTAAAEGASVLGLSRQTKDAKGTGAEDWGKPNPNPLT